MLLIIVPCFPDSEIIPDELHQVLHVDAKVCKNLIGAVVRGESKAKDFFLMMRNSLSVTLLKAKSLSVDETLDIYAQIWIESSDSTTPHFQTKTAKVNHLVWNETFQL